MISNPFPSFLTKYQYQSCEYQLVPNTEARLPGFAKTSQIFVPGPVQTWYKLFPDTTGQLRRTVVHIWHFQMSSTDTCDCTVARSAKTKQYRFKNTLHNIPITTYCIYRSIYTQTWKKDKMRCFSKVSGYHNFYAQTLRHKSLDQSTGWRPVDWSNQNFPYLITVY